ncbi:tetratricopeptide repeat protein [Cystobacter fuscus]|uniref:tetratricopeptide repeat protein n=1 Tax=Cystobacter fuscus TaxID=43 RepID=UPI0037BFB236
MSNEPRAEEAREEPGVPRAENQDRARRVGMDPGVRKVLLVCLAALVFHLLVMLLPRNMPEQELAIARAIPDSSKRVALLKPLKDHPKATGANLREAAELLREGSPMDAYELTKESERREPGSVETQLLMARICHGQRMNRCEEESLRKAEEVAPGDGRSALLRADFREEEGDLAGALKSVEEAYHKEPGRKEVGVRYARLLSAAHQGEEALEVLRTQGVNLGKARLWLEEGLVRVDQGRLEEARQLFSRAVEADPKLAMGYYHLGVTAFRLGDIQAAEDALRTADRLDMTDMKALSALCAIQRSTGRTDAVTATRMDLERRFPERLDAVRTACITR